MRLKSYFVNTMEEALQVAKLELGVDAMLVDTKRLATPPGSRSRLEVIFAAPTTPPPPPQLQTPPPMAAPDSIPGLQRFRGELTNLLDALTRTPDAARLETLTPAMTQLDTLRMQLLQSEVPRPFADEIVQMCRPILEGFVLRGGDDLTEVRTLLVQLLGAEWPAISAEGCSAAQTLVFVGPAGAGKTSAIAKLAFHLGVSSGKPVTVVSIDNLKIGAGDQLAHICSLLGVPFHSLDFGVRLATAVEPFSHRGITLIDTPGFGVGDRDILGDIASNVGQVDGIQCHLVLPATLRYGELQRRYQQFEPFLPARLLFTRLDETEFFGPAWAFARDRRIAVDWVSTGPGIPEDLAIADAHRFAEALLGPTAPLTTPASSSSHLASAASAGGSRI
jgi:flagellar biosynthesis protein FlhF